jgi:predicted nucleotidyltransferase
MNTQDFQLLNPIFEENEISFAGIFGSYARGEEKTNSDVDMLVRFTKPQGLLALVSLEQKLSDLLKKDVDLVTERALSPYIHDDVMKDLQVIYEKR